MNHTHPNPNQLHTGCDACIELVRRDQQIDELGDLDDDQLLELAMGRDHIEGDWLREAIDAEMARRATLDDEETA